ncbi:MAG TPA: hypothetical protein DCS21_05170 [Gammaproteobacteria bacterium]|nr:hypothetical protein [Gammaproteobacteria bacterium]
MKKKLTDAEVADKCVAVGEDLLRAFSEIRNKHKVPDAFVGHLILPALKYSGVMLGGHVSREEAENAFFQAFDLGARITGHRP